MIINILSRMNERFCSHFYMTSLIGLKLGLLCPIILLEEQEISDKHYTWNTWHFWQTEANYTIIFYQTLFFKAPHSTLNHHNLSRNIHLEPEISDKPKHIDTKHIHMNIITESHRDKINKMVYAPSEDSDQLGHLPSLISLGCFHEEWYGL